MPAVLLLPACFVLTYAGVPWSSLKAGPSLKLMQSMCMALWNKAWDTDHTIIVLSASLGIYGNFCHALRHQNKCYASSLSCSKAVLDIFFIF